uniref:Uncharacterized protein n=1 Tax=Cannabis sativa TaxID=3483 RepID=A0A803QPI0_CANSA
MGKWSTGFGYGLVHRRLRIIMKLVCRRYGLREARISVASLPLPESIFSRSHGLAHFIANTIGNLIEVHLPSLYDSITPFMRIRVLLDTTKSLFRGMNVHFRKLSLTKWLKFQYEGIQNYCYHYDAVDQFLVPSIANTSLVNTSAVENPSTLPPPSAPVEDNHPPPVHTSLTFRNLTCSIDFAPVMTTTVITSSTKGKAPMYPKAPRDIPAPPIRPRARVAPVTIFGTKRSYTRQSCQVGSSVRSMLKRARSSNCDFAVVPTLSHADEEAGSSRAFQTLSLLVTQHRLKILFVMEIKQPTNSISLFKAKLSFDNAFEWEAPVDGLSLKARALLRSTKMFVSPWLVAVAKFVVSSEMAGLTTSTVSMEIFVVQEYGHKDLQLEDLEGVVGVLLVLSMAFDKK